MFGDVRIIENSVQKNVYSKNLNKKIKKVPIANIRAMTRANLFKKIKNVRSQLEVRYDKTYIEDARINTNDLKKLLKRLQQRMYAQKKRRTNMFGNRPVNRIQRNYVLIDEIDQYKQYRVSAETKNLLEMYKVIKNIDMELKRDHPNSFENAFPATILFYKIENQNRVRKTTIDVDYLDSFNDFVGRVEEIQRGEVEGSGKFLENKYTLIVNKFDIAYYTVDALGKSKNMLYKCMGLDDGVKGTCLHQVAKHLGVKNIAKRCSELSKFLDEAQMQNIDLKIYSNSFKLKHGFENLKSCKIKKHIAYKIEDKDIENCVYIEPEDENRAKHKLIYCETNQHIDILTTEKPEIKDEIYLTRKMHIINKNKIILKHKQHRKNKDDKAKIPPENLNIFFDYETIIKWSDVNVMVPYALSVLIVTDEELKKLNQLEKNNNKKMIKKYVEAHCINWRGYDCSKKFYNKILEIHLNKYITLISFNGANFDNFILLKDFSEIDSDAIRNIRYNGNQILNFQIAGRHSLFDVHKHLTGSLKECCKGFGIKNFCKKDLSHKYAQKQYDTGTLEDSLKGVWGKKLKKYNNYDVLSLGLLFYRYREALINVPLLKKYGTELHKYPTIGKIIYDIFQRHIKYKNINLPKLTLKQYKALQKYKVAGRVELFNGVKHIKKRISSADVCSLYPYICAILNIYMPCGEIKTIKETKIFHNVETKKSDIDKRIYFLYCDVDQSNLKGKNFPTIYPNKTKKINDWKETKLKGYLLSSPMIEQFEMFDCDVKILDKEGFYFTEKVKNYEMFGFLHELMTIKNFQDCLKRKKDPKHNPALRECVKLLMNAISGKVIEGLHNKKTVEISTNTFMKLKKKKTVSNLTAINKIGAKIFCSYKVTEESILGAQRPIYLGVLIYDYAKCYMYNNIYAPVGLKNLLYTDTDAAKLRYKHLLHWVKKYAGNRIVPHWKYIETIDERYKTHKLYEQDSKVFGSFEEELPPENIGGIFTNKKCWHVYCKDKSKNKFGFKGISKKDVYLQNLDHDFLKSRIIHHKDGTQTKKVNVIDAQKAYYFYNSSDDTFENKNKDLFMELHTKKSVYILCQSFRKSVNNTLQKVELEDSKRYNKHNNTLQCVYTVKKLKC